MPLFSKENHLLRFLDFLSLLTWTGVVALSPLLKLPPKKLRLDWLCEFRSPEVALYLCKSTLRPCMEYFCHVWAGAPSCYLNMLDKLHKRVFRNVEFSLSASLEPLAHRRNIAILGIFCSYYFGRCLSELP